MRGILKYTMFHTKWEVDDITSIMRIFEKVWDYFSNFFKVKCKMFIS